MNSATTNMGVKVSFWYNIIFFREIHIIIIYESYSFFEELVIFPMMATLIYVSANIVKGFLFSESLVIFVVFVFLMIGSLNVVINLQSKLQSIGMMEVK